MLTAKTLFYRLGRDRESFWTATLTPPHQPQNPKLHQTSVKWIQFQTKNVGSAAWSWSRIEFSLSCWVSVCPCSRWFFSQYIWWKDTYLHDQMNIWNCKKINLEILMTVHFVLLQRGKNGNRGCHPFEPALYIQSSFGACRPPTLPGITCDFKKNFFFLSLLPPQQNSICLLWRKVHLLLLKERKNSLRKFINQSERFWFHFLCRKSKVI